MVILGTWLVSWDNFIPNRLYCIYTVLANSVTYYDPNTGTELNAEITDLKQNNSIATKIYQRSLCHCEENSCNCCVGIRFFRFNGPVCIRITISEDSKAVITANGDPILTHYFRSKNFISFSFCIFIELCFLTIYFNCSASTPDMCWSFQAYRYLRSIRLLLY